MKLESGDYELGMDEMDTGRPLLLYLVAEGATPYEFFGNAGVEGVDDDGDLREEWAVAEKRKYGPWWREDAIAMLIEAWSAKNGPIARFEVDAILDAKAAEWKAARIARRPGFEGAITESDRRSA